MTAAAVTVKRTGWDVALGIALAIAGLVLLGDAALATAVSVWLIGILLGVQVLLEGLSLVVVGRLHPADSED